MTDASDDRVPAAPQSGISEPAPWRPSPQLRVIGVLVGVLLLAAAVVVIILQRDTLSNALASLRQPDPVLVVLLLMTVVVHLALSGTFLSLLMSRYGRVGFLEMQAVVATTALLNYLPLRPGLFGRLAYHKAVNGIPLIDSSKTVVQGLTLTGLMGAYLVVGVWTSLATGLALWIILVIPAPVLLSGLAIRQTRFWAAACGLRYVELLMWAVRYILAFQLLGVPIAWTTAIAFASVGVLTGMVPLVSNGLGLREWAIGLMAPWLAGLQMGEGLAGELVNRAADMVVIALAGLVGMLVLRRVYGRHFGAYRGAPPTR